MARLCSRNRAGRASCARVRALALSAATKRQPPEWLRLRLSSKSLTSARFPGDQRINYLIETLSLTEHWREFPLKFSDSGVILIAYPSQVIVSKNRKVLLLIHNLNSSPLEIRVTPRPCGSIVTKLPARQLSPSLLFKTRDCAARPIPLRRI